jgi:hypothetical protein
LDDDYVTIITDQDKGSKAAIVKVLPKAVNFHCSWHRRANIGKVSLDMCFILKEIYSSFSSSIFIERIARGATSRLQPCGCLNYLLIVTPSKKSKR